MRAPSRSKGEYRAAQAEDPPVTGRRILVTGFAPFGGEAVNPSWLVAQALHRRQIAGCRVQAVELPCEFGTALDALDDALARWQPMLVLALGQAGGRAELSIERVAINVDDARIADNAGRQPVDVPVVARGPAAYFSTLPIKAMVAGVRQAGIAAVVSQTAGTFVCNHVFYGLQHRLRRTPVRSGFMHVPWLPGQAAALAGQPSLTLAQMLRGTRAALATALRHTGPDLEVPGGALD